MLQPGHGFLSDAVKLLEKRGLPFRCDSPTDDNGNCFPFAVMQQLRRPKIRSALSAEMTIFSEDCHKLRLAVVNFVKNISPLSEYYTPIYDSIIAYRLSHSGTWEARLSEMSCDRSWFDDQFIQFTSWFLKKDIFCHAPTFTKFYCGSPEGSACQCLGESLQIAHVRDCHFQSVIPIESTDEDLDTEMEKESGQSSIGPVTSSQFQCDQCNKSFIRPQLLDLHIKTVHPITFPCDDCEERFLSIDLQLRHYKEIHLSSEDKTSVFQSKFSY